MMRRFWKTVGVESRDEGSSRFLPPSVLSTQSIERPLRVQARSPSCSTSGRSRVPEVFLCWSARSTSPSRFASPTSGRTRRPS